MTKITENAIKKCHNKILMKKKWIMITAIIGTILIGAVTVEPMMNFVKNYLDG